MTKYENINLNTTHQVKVKKIYDDTLKAWFTEGKTYKMEAIRFDHNDDYEWTTTFRCFDCDKAGFACINEFNADIEII